MPTYKKAYMAIVKTVILFVVLITIYLFGFTESYKTSLKAKWKYFEGEYKEANRLAKEAFDLDPYNRMAIGVLAQSKISVAFVEYIEDAKRYLKEIEKMTKKEDFGRAEKMKIKMMCEVMIGHYQKLNPTVMTERDLKEEASRYYKRFKTIYDRFFSDQNK